MSLFQLGDFVLSSGTQSNWKIECEALTTDDWKALAAMAAEVLPPFRWVEGVPRGGLPFAAELAHYARADSMTLLIAEDVVTTGGSMERHRNGRSLCVGICVFARGPVPEWVTPLFQMPRPIPTAKRPSPRSPTPWY